MRAHYQHFHAVEATIIPMIGTDQFADYLGFARQWVREVWNTDIPADIETVLQKDYEMMVDLRNAVAHSINIGYPDGAALYARIAARHGAIVAFVEGY